ncbi:MAG: AAA family ATPase [Geminicoccaceae bacterium]|nr:AAA family ATPase [Geminicoccaceae bacterium]MDW8123568.1 AAA family ATPase [Geminicoccaceae bacterium]
MSKALVRDVAAQERPQLRAFVADEETRAVIGQVAGDLMITGAAIHNGTVRDAIEALGRQRSPRILIVDISASELPLSDIDELAEVCEPGVSVIAIGERNDVGLFRELVHHGITDYLVKPVTATLLQRALVQAVEGTAPHQRQSGRLGRIVAVLGARGGVGATMVATSLAWSIATGRHRRVVLFDLDLQFGSVALSLDLDPVNGLRDAVENPGRIDGLYLDRTLVRHSETLFVLGAEEPLDDVVRADRDAVGLLLQELQTKFHFVVVDLPRQVSVAAQQVLQSATNLVLVSDFSLAGMRDTMRIVQLMHALNVGCAVTVVVNKAGEYRAGEIPRGEFERGIGRSIDLVLPFDARRVCPAINSGRPVASAGGPVADLLRELADRICGNKVAARAGLLRRLLAGLR